MKTHVWMSLALWSVAVQAAPAEDVFRYTRTINVAASQQQDLASVALDADVFAATRDGYPDLRILDERGQAVSCLLRRALAERLQKVKTTWAAHDPVVKPLADGSLEITVRLSEKDRQPNGLCLVSPLGNFQQRVRIEASADGVSFQQVAETTIYDYSQYIDARNDCISLPTSTHRYYRITIDDVTAEQESELLELTRRLRGGQEDERSERVTIARRPFRIDKIEFWADVQRRMQEQVQDVLYTSDSFRLEEDSAKHQTIVTLDTEREPLVSFMLVMGDKNFSRHVTVEASDPRGSRSNWRKVGEKTISRIDYQKLHRNDLKIPIRETRAPQYRITIDNRDSRPLKITSIQAERNVYELVFLANPNSKYELIYGSAEAKEPNYDTTAIATLLSEGYSPTEASLAPQAETAGVHRPEPLDWLWFLNDPRVLIPLIVVLVALLGMGLYQATKRLDRVE